MGEFLDYFKNKKNLANLLLLGILVLAIPLGVNLIKQQQILKSRATASAIVFSGPNVKTINNKVVATKPDVTLEITAPGDSGTGVPPTGSCPTQEQVAQAGLDKNPGVKGEILKFSGWPANTPALQIANEWIKIAPQDSNAQQLKKDLETAAACKSANSGGLGNLLVGTVYAEDNYCLAAGYHACTVGTPAGSCSKDGKTCTAYETYQCNFGGQNYCDTSNCAEPCSGGVNYCEAAGYHKCGTIGANLGSCTTAGKTCTKFETYQCNYGGANYCGDSSANPECREPCGGSGKKTYVCDGSIPPDVVTPTGKAGVDYKWTVDCNKQCNSNADCPQNNFDSNVDPGTSNWCYGFDGPKKSTEDWRCLKLVTSQCPSAGAPGCGKLTCNIGNQTPDLGDACAVCIDKNSGGDGNRLTDKIKQMDSKFGGCSTKQLINYWCNGGIGSDATKQCTSAKTSTACTSQCAGAKAPQITVAFFRLSEDLNNWSSAPITYTSPGPVKVPWTFKDIKPGTKTIFVQFYNKDDKQVGDRVQAYIELLGGESTIASCSLSFEGQNVTYEINGTNFGSDKGGVASDSTPLDIKSWSPTQIKASFTNPPTGQSFPITVTNTFGQSVTGQCSAISQVSVGAKVFCSAPSNHDTDNVDLELAGVFKGGKLIKQKVKIDKDGVIQGLDQKLETGKKYKLSLKAPKSLRKTSGVFTAEDGVTTVPNFVLPVGDIFPADGGDSLINPFDYGELVRQWIISADATGRSGDFNLDGRVNSIDWACMRTSMKDNGGSGDDPEPVPGEPVASPIPSVNPSPSASLAP